MAAWYTPVESKATTFPFASLIAEASVGGAGACLAVMSCREVRSSTRDGMEIGAANATATRERMVMMENCMIIDGRLPGSE